MLSLRDIPPSNYKSKWLWKKRMFIMHEGSQFHIQQVIRMKARPGNVGFQYAVGAVNYGPKEFIQKRRAQPVQSLKLTKNVFNAEPQRCRCGRPKSETIARRAARDNSGRSSAARIPTSHPSPALTTRWTWNESFTPSGMRERGRMFYLLA